MITISEETVRRAFDCLEERYQNWFGDPRAMLNLYEAAETAFEGQGSLEEFETVYEELRGKWQVFRGSKEYWDSEQTYNALRRLPRHLRNKSLSDNIDDWGDVWNAITSLREIKHLKTGPSLVAISKFLHFWNPRLFVIFDSEVVENWVFRHKYLAEQLNSEAIGRALQLLELENNSRLVKYLRVLVFASNLAKENHNVLSAFSERVPDAIKTYEATAVEWFLLGLVELLPSGVKVTVETP